MVVGPTVFGGITKNRPCLDGWGRGASSQFCGPIVLSEISKFSLPGSVGWDKGGKFVISQLLGSNLCVALGSSNAPMCGSFKCVCVLSRGPLVDL